MKAALRAGSQPAVAVAHDMFEGLMPVRRWLRQRKSGLPEEAPPKTLAEVAFARAGDAYNRLKGTLRGAASSVGGAAAAAAAGVVDKAKSAASRISPAAAVAVAARAPETPEVAPAAQAEGEEPAPAGEAGSAAGEAAAEGAVAEGASAAAAHDAGGAPPDTALPEPGPELVSLAPQVPATPAAPPDEEGEIAPLPAPDAFDLMTPFELFEQVVLTGESRWLKTVVKASGMSKKGALWKRMLTGIKFDRMDVLKQVYSDAARADLDPMVQWCLKNKNERAAGYLRGGDPDAEAEKKRRRAARYEGQRDS